MSEKNNLLPLVAAFLAGVAVAAVVFVHIDTAAAGRAGHAGEEQEDDESE